MKHLYAKLSIDDREALADILQSAGWKPLLHIIEQLVIDAEQAVIRRHIEDGVEKLVHAKLRAEGARKLASDVVQFKEHFKKTAK